VNKVLAIALSLSLGAAGTALGQTTQQQPKPATPAAPQRTCASYYIPYGKLQMQNGQFEIAQYNFRYCVLLEPKNVEGLFQLGRSETHLGLYSAAIDHLQDAIKLDSRYVPAYVAMAQAYTEQYRTATDKRTVSTALDRALQYLDDGERVATKNPDKAAVYNQRGLIYTQRQDFDRAVTAYREAIRLNPADSVPHANLGAVLMRIGDLDGAVRSLRDAIEARPTDFVSRAFLAKALIQKNDYAGAKSEAAQAFRTNADSKKHPFVVGQYGAALYHTKDLDGARTMLETATKLLKAISYPENFYWLGRVYLDRGDAKSAVSNFTKATALSANDPEYWYYLGRANEANANKAAAAQSYEKTLAVRTPYKDAADRLKTLK